MTGLLIGADIGTSALKAVLAHPERGVLAVTEHAYPMRRPHPGWAENDPEDWWTALRAAVPALLAAAGAVGADVAALCVVGQRDPFVLVDEAGAPLAPAIHWTDHRDTAGTDAVFDRVGRERITDVSGVPPTTGLVLPNLDWTRRALPDAYAAATHALQPKDFVRMRLTGDRSTDTSSPSRSHLNDWRTDTWSGELCEAAGLDVRLLPEIRYGAWEATGRLTAAAAAALGLTTSVVVAAGGGDDQAAALGSGALEPGDLSLGTGSSLAWRAVVRQPRVDATGRLCIARHVVPDSFIYEAVGVGTGTMLRWIRELLAQPGAEPPAYEQLIEAAAAIPPGAGGVTCYPYPDGATLPWVEPDVRAAILGLSLAHGRGHVIRAVLEGVAYLYPPILRILAEFGVEARSLTVIDGESRSATWNQLKADVTGREIRTTRVPEASALGAAILAGMAMGTFADAEAGAGALIERGPAFAPDPSRSAVYARLQAAWEANAPAAFAASRHASASRL